MQRFEYWTAILTLVTVGAWLVITEAAGLSIVALFRDEPLTAAQMGHIAMSILPFGLLAGKARQNFTSQ